MLKSVEILHKVKEENRRHYDAIRSIGEISKTEDELYHSTIEKLSLEFEQARNEELNQVNVLKRAFDAAFPKTLLDYFTEREINNVIGEENFYFMRQMRLFECCGMDAEGYLFAPVWR